MTTAQNFQYSGSDLEIIRLRVENDIRKARIIRARRAMVGFFAEVKTTTIDTQRSAELRDCEKKLSKHVAALIRDDEMIDMILDKIENLTGIPLEEGE